MSSTATDYGERYPPRDLVEAIAQIKGGDFCCARCVYYQGGCQCGLGVLILVVGQDMSKCQYFETGIKCRHCGRLI